jgi:hypothetical protein
MQEQVKASQSGRLAGQNDGLLQIHEQELGSKVKLVLHADSLHMH